jgi:hypothetical protein
LFRLAPSGFSLPVPRLNMLGRITQTLNFSLHPKKHPDFRPGDGLLRIFSHIFALQNAFCKA